MDLKHPSTCHGVEDVIDWDAEDRMGDERVRKRQAGEEWCDEGMINWMG